MEKFEAALEFLQEKYSENPKMYQFLYQYGKICMKSKLDKFSGTGLGALREVKRFIKNYPKLYYWLGKACFKSGRIFQAQKYLMKANVNLPSTEVKKLKSIQKMIEKLQNRVNLLNSIRKNLKNNIFTEKLESDSLLKKPDLFHVVNLIKDETFLDAGIVNEALQLLSTINRIEAFKVLIKCCNTSFTFEVSDQIIFSALKNLNKPEIPTYEIVSACIKYSKFLYYNKKIKKSLFILKALIKLYPN